VPIGYSTFPGKAFSFSLGGDYKGFDFSVLFQGAADVSFSHGFEDMKVFGAGRSIPKYLRASWTQERYEQGLPIEFPVLSEDYLNYRQSTLWTVDASYLRVKNIEIGYRFKNRFFDMINIDSSRLFVNANNIYTWSGMREGFDPETGASDGDNNVYPNTRTFNLGFNVQF